MTAPRLRFIIKLFHFLGISQATIRHLDVEHLADGRRDIHYVGRGGGCSMGDVPSHKHKGNMRVVGVPLAMLRADILGGVFSVEVLRSCHYGNFAAAHAIVTIDNHFLDTLGNGGFGNLLIIHHEKVLLVLL